MLLMNSKQRKTLESIFTRPLRADIYWTDIESLFRSLGASVESGSGIVDPRSWTGYYNGSLTEMGMN